MNLQCYSDLSSHHSEYQAPIVEDGLAVNYVYNHSVDQERTLVTRLGRAAYVMPEVARSGHCSVLRSLLLLRLFALSVFSPSSDNPPS